MAKSLDLSNSVGLKLDIKRKFVYRGTRGRLNNRCNNRGLLVIKQ